MADINAMKLKRLKAHFENDGAATPEAVATILGSKPANTEFLRSYVEAADPDQLDDFNRAVAAAANPPASTEPAPAPSTAANRPPAADELRSQPESSLPKPSAAERVAALPVATVVDGLTPPSVDGIKFRLRNPDGTASELNLVAQKGSTVILEKAPESEIVNLTLRGVTYALDVVALRKLPPDSVYETANGSFPVSSLLAAAQLAKP